MIVTVLVVICFVLLLVCGAGGAYLLVVLPRRWREPMTEALSLIDSDDRADLERADRLLGLALSNGPPRRALHEAKFTQAFVRAILGHYDGSRYGAAAAVVEELIAASGRDSATSYLELWIHARLDNHDRVCDLYDNHRNLLADNPNSRRIAAASSLRLASEHWRRREIDGALHYFDTVRELGELTDQIPAGVDNLQLIQGIQAVFDNRLDDARAAFAGARQRAVERHLPTVEADAGLLACDWHQGDPAELARRLAELAAQLDRVSPVTEQGRLRAPVALLRLIALLRTWVARPEARPPTETDHRELEDLVTTVHEADPDMGDAYLIAGLIRYYFAGDADGREQGLAELEHGGRVASGIMLPEVLDLIQRERALGGQGDAISRYLGLVNEILANPALAAQYQAEYRRISARFEPYADSSAVEELRPHQAAPIEEYQHRVEALRRRVHTIVYPRIRDLGQHSPAANELRTLVSSLDDTARSHSDATQTLRSAEFQLITQIGDMLLPEDDVADIDTQP